MSNDPLIIYTVKEAAEKLKVAETTMRHYLRTGKIIGARVGKEWRISLQALERFVGIGPTLQGLEDQTPKKVKIVDEATKEMYRLKAQKMTEARMKKKAMERLEKEQAAQAEAKRAEMEPTLPINFDE